MPTIEWDQIDKVRDVVALARSLETADEGSELLDPYLKKAIHAAIDLYTYSDDYEEAQYTGRKLPDHEDRLAKLGESLGEIRSVVKAAAVLIHVLAHQLGSKLDMTADDVLDSYARWLATFNPSEFPMDPDQMDLP